MSPRHQHDLAVTPTPPPIEDEPGFHGFFMIGMQTLYLSHMPMFTVQRHMYQVILRATLPPEIMDEYRAGRKAGPTAPYNLNNSADDAFALPELSSGRRKSFEADIYKDYSNEDGQPVGDPFAKEVPVTVDQIVQLRHFNFDHPRPEHLNYIIFGSGTEAHLSHYIARDPDYQHIVTLGSVPDWLLPIQVEGSSVLTFSSLPSLPVPCSDPLTEPSYQVLFQGWDVQQFTLNMGGATNLWFSSGNMLNQTDPCAAS